MKEKVFKEKRISANKEKIKKLIKKLKVVYTDVDSTLVGQGGSLFRTADGKLTMLPANALLKCHQHKVDITLVSGRSSHQLQEDARILGLKNYLAELGCEIVYNLGETVVLNVGNFFNKKGKPHDAIANSGAVELLFSSFPGYLEHHTPWSEWRNCTTVFRGYIDISKAQKILNQNGYGWLQLIDNGVIQRRGTLSPNITEVHAYHLIPKEIGKAKGVLKDREIRKIPKESCIAIGDSLSDSELATVVGAFFLVRNGLIEDNKLLKTLLETENAFVTEEEMGLGFAQVIELLLEED